jgi:hypothetical protein
VKKMMKTDGFTKVKSKERAGINDLLADFYRQAKTNGKENGLLARKEYEVPGGLTELEKLALDVAQKHFGNEGAIEKEADFFVKRQANSGVDTLPISFGLQEVLLQNKPNENLKAELYFGCDEGKLHFRHLAIEVSQGDTSRYVLFNHFIGLELAVQDYRRENLVVQTSLEQFNDRPTLHAEIVKPNKTSSGFFMVGYSTGYQSWARLRFSEQEPAEADLVRIGVRRRPFTTASTCFVGPENQVLVYDESPFEIDGDVRPRYYRDGSLAFNRITFLCGSEGSLKNYLTKTKTHGVLQLATPYGKVEFPERFDTADFLRQMRQYLLRG